MAGSLVKIQETTVTSAVASVTLTGIDSTYDVYMVKLNNVVPVDDNKYLIYRFTVGGTADSSANYDQALKELRADSAFDNVAQTNQTSGSFDNAGTGTEEQNNNVMYLFNFNNASEYSFATVEGSARSSAGHLRARQGGSVLTVAQACDGIQFLYTSGNIDNGTFTLYGLKK